MNIAFCYLYRLTPNFTEYHEVEFTNIKRIPQAVIQKIITSNLNSNCCFIPDEWQLPNLVYTPQHSGGTLPYHQFLHTRPVAATTAAAGDIAILLHTIQLHAAVHKVL